ncbi:hypothetical protein IT414_01055 [bacterium]|nr:hypothetical protein [bacterium]
MVLFGAQPSHAANAGDFQAGRIIDDAVFTNKSAMSVSDIQNFLNSKVPVCDTYHPAGPSAQGAQPPWICLKNYSEGGRSAAQIIYDAAQTYSINPRVILVTLQKENGLITDTWPYPWQYRTAMGFGCPDGAPCDAQWYGFTNQVNQGARHFRGFFDNSLSFVPYRPGNNFIQYNPNSGCGGTTLNIQNKATAALYSYTPYQPNAAALNNLYGSGDGCSAYGNRNFWRDYTDWFGSTLQPSYAWQYVGQTSSVGGNFVATQKATWTLTAKNTGTATWTNSGANPIRLGTNSPRDRASVFCGCQRAATLNEASVAPGQNGTFTFEVQAPTATGSYKEYFNLVAEGVTWLNDPGLFWGVTVVAANYSGTKLSDSLPSSLAVGVSGSGSLVIRNDSNVAWYNNGRNPILLGTSNPTDRSSAFIAAGWLGPNRPTRMAEAVVAPGQNATFSFALKAPSQPGGYNENFQLLAEGYRWFGQNISHPITVTGQQNTPVGTMSSSQSLGANQALVSQDGRYRLIMQGDGNLVLYSPSRAIWSTRTSGKPSTRLDIQGDGNLVLYGNDGRYYWASWTQGRQLGFLNMQNDGNLVLYDSQGRPIWSTGTSGRI